PDRAGRPAGRPPRPNHNSGCILTSSQYAWYSVDEVAWRRPIMKSRLLIACFPILIAGCAAGGGPGTGGAGGRAATADGAAGGNGPPAGAGGEVGDGGGAGTGGSPAAGDDAAACAALSAALCGKIESCTPFATGLLFGSREACEQRLGLECLARLVAP